MKWNCWAITLIATWLVSCETAHEIGRAITAPVRHVFNEPEPTPAANASDVTNPGQPVALPSPSPSPASRTALRKSKRVSASPSPRIAANKTTVKPSSSPHAQFPVAKPVPGKPGLVFNPFNASGGYIDVSGYAPGSKVKDPDSQKIFIVP